MLRCGSIEVSKLTCYEFVLGFDLLKNVRTTSFNYLFILNAYNVT